MSDCDVLVVGSGPLGIAAARCLAERGLAVTVVEGGAAITDPPASHFRNQARFVKDPDSYFTAIERFFAPVAGDLPGAADSSLVGGQGILWTNNCPRAAPHERWDAMAPERWDEAYGEAEALLQVVPDPSVSSRTGAAVAERLRGALAEQGRTIEGMPLCGRVLADGTIHFDAPRDILDAAAPEARGRITLRSGAAVTRLRHRGGRVSGVDLAGGPGIEAPVVLVASGAIGTARLLHRSNIRPESLGVGISFHALLFAQVVLTADLCPPADASDLPPRLTIPPTETAGWHLQVMRDTCPLSAAEAVDNPHRLLEFQGMVPMTFRDDNALVMDDDGATARFAFCERDHEHMRAMEADVRRLGGHLGPWRRGCEPTWLPHGTCHILGTCRMDRDSWPGVADRRGKVHGFDNLYLATVGLIPAPIGVNPTLTALALALNTCEAITAGA